MPHDHDEKPPPPEAPPAFDFNKLPRWRSKLFSAPDDPPAEPAPQKPAPAQARETAPEFDPDRPPPSPARPSKRSHRHPGASPYSAQALKSREQAASGLSREERGERIKRVSECRHKTLHTEDVHRHGLVLPHAGTGRDDEERTRARGACAHAQAKGPAAGAGKRSGAALVDPHRRGPRRERGVRGRAAARRGARLRRPRPRRMGHAPYGGFTLADGAERTLRTGLRWKTSGSATVALEAERQNEGADASPTNALMLRAQVRF